MYDCFVARTLIVDNVGFVRAANFDELLQRFPKHKVLFAEGNNVATNKPSLDVAPITLAKAVNFDL